jgi:hypothetical protein
VGATWRRRGGDVGATWGRRGGDVGATWRLRTRGPRLAFSLSHPRNLKQVPLKANRESRLRVMMYGWTGTRKYCPKERTATTFTSGTCSEVNAAGDTDRHARGGGGGGELHVSAFQKRTYKQTPWPLVRKRTIPTERLPLVGEI